MGQTGKELSESLYPSLSRNHCPSPPRLGRLGSSLIRYPSPPRVSDAVELPDWRGGEGTTAWAGTPVTSWGKSLPKLRTSFFNYKMGESNIHT